MRVRRPSPGTYPGAQTSPFTSFEQSEDHMDWNQPIRLRASRAVRLAHGDPLDTFHRHRVCNVDQCTVRLSRYNPSQLCGRHKGWREEPQKRTRRART